MVPRLNGESFFRNADIFAFQLHRFADQTEEPSWSNEQNKTLLALSLIILTAVGSLSIHIKIYFCMKPITSFS